MTSEAAKYGFNALLHVASMLSLALAIFNVLPIPILDGGHLLFLGIEKLRKKPLNEKVEQKITDIGFGFIIILAVFILFTKSDKTEKKPVPTAGQDESGSGPEGSDPQA